MERTEAGEIYLKIIFDNNGDERLIQDSHIDREQLDEIAELIVDTVCTVRKTIRIAGGETNRQRWSNSGL